MEVLLFIGFVVLIVFLDKRDRNKNKKKIIKIPSRGKDWYYNIYLPSDHWQKRRIEALKKADFTCQCCNSKKELQVHHLTYRNVWKEKDEDLKVVCRACHRAIHKIEEGVA